MTRAMDHHASRLLIDLGNSQLKWATQQPRAGAAISLSRAGRAPHQDGHCAALLAAIGGQAFDEVWLSSVAGAGAERLAVDLSTVTSAPLFRAHSPAAMDGIRNAYAQPRRLGVDRFLALLGGRVRYPARALLVVDAGTALTIDVLAADGTHLGGSIAPGLALMRQSLGRGTASLGEAIAPPSLALNQLGSDTALAIESGILAAACGAIALRREQYAAMDARLLLTGGDAPQLADALTGAELLPDLVLEGLARYADCFVEG